MSCFCGGGRGHWQVTESAVAKAWHTFSMPLHSSKSAAIARRRGGVVGGPADVRQRSERGVPCFGGGNQQRRPGRGAAAAKACPRRRTLHPRAPAVAEGPDRRPGLPAAKRCHPSQLSIIVYFFCADSGRTLLRFSSTKRKPGLVASTARETRDLGVLVS